jgi:hypothetical protein
LFEAIDALLSIPTRPDAGDMGQRRNGLAGLDHFAEALALGIFTDEARVEDVPRITR